MKSLKIIFFGSSEYSIPTLSVLVKAGCPIQAAVTLPERKGGRGQEVLPSPVREWAEAHKIKAFQQEKMADPSFQETLKALSPDLFIVVSFGKFLPSSLLQIPKLYALNIHPSLLPKFRGPSPVAWAILEGDQTTGVTLIRVNERIDAGEILLKEEHPIAETDDVHTLSERLFQKGAELLLKGLSLIEEGHAQFTPQDEKKATYAPRLKKSDGDIDWSDESRRIARQIRAFKGWPGSFTFYQGRRLILWKVHPQAKGGPVLGENRSKQERPGQVIALSKEGIVVATGDGALLIQELQLEGKERLAADRFLAGHPLTVGETFACNPGSS